MNLPSNTRGRTTLRMIFTGIILLTLPFYCLGLILWGTAPARGVINRTLTPGATATLPTLDGATAVVTNTPPPLVQPTLPQFPTVGGGFPVQPPTAQFPPVVTVFFTPTNFIFPTDTPAPTLTPFPTLTNTPIPQPTNTLIPTLTETPIPTLTETSTPTPTPTSTLAEEATPIPFDN